MLARKVRRVRKKLRNMKEARGGKGLSQPVRKLGEKERRVKERGKGLMKGKWRAHGKVKSGDEKV